MAMFVLWIGWEHFMSNGIKHKATADAIREECQALADMLVKKNEAYGDSALNPRRIFSRADPLEQIKVRLDDKLSRLANSKDGEVDSFGEDVEKDLLGYLILLRVARARRAAVVPEMEYPIGGYRHAHANRNKGDGQRNPDASNPL